ncbi:MAG: nickel pincer cofactor biosynthesis protein LarC [bacterium]|nr:nickel pincer cofactor biosynthesis protein LarC [bacterium]
MDKLFTQSDKLLLVDAPAGIAGDMFLMAMVDLGFDISELVDAFNAKGGITLKVEVEEVISGGLRGRRLQCEAVDPQPHRHLSHCLEFIDRLELPDEAADLARRLFRRLAEVEGGLHGHSAEDVHFHEVGAVDSLFDIIGAALALYRLGVGHLYLRHLSVGCGTINVAHGELPLPAPATLELLKGLELTQSDRHAELVTPTGALILSGCSTPLPRDLRWRALATGYGAGHREMPGLPNLLRLTLAEDGTSRQEGLTRRRLPVVRCTLDDMNPERFGFLMERLLENGALDVHYRPLQMKKNRPGLEVEVLVTEADLDKIVNIVFAETTTLGLRICHEERLELPREIIPLTTPHGEVRIKVATLPDGTRRGAPEYEDCARLAREQGLPLAVVEEAARSAWQVEGADS